MMITIPKSTVSILLIIILLICTVACEKESNNDYRILVDSRDNKHYKIIQIGDQLWMAENLNYYTESGSWSYNDSIKYSDIYGRLYNWETACNVCPKGWHLPTENEWTILSDYNGGISFAGINLKTEDTMYWSNNGLGGTNESGFSALPAGFRSADGVFKMIGTYTGYWSSTNIPGSSSAWCRRLSSYHNNFYLSSEDINSGRSVRCLRDY